jgi:hypothetical protein
MKHKVAHHFSLINAAITSSAIDVAYAIVVLLNR